MVTCAFNPSRSEFGASLVYRGSSRLPGRQWWCQAFNPITPETEIFLCFCEFKANYQIVVAHTFNLNLDVKQLVKRVFKAAIERQRRQYRPGGARLRKLKDSWVTSDYSVYSLSDISPFPRDLALSFLYSCNTWHPTLGHEFLPSLPKKPHLLARTTQTCGWGSD